MHSQLVAQSASSGAGSAGYVVLLVVAIAAYIGYNAFKKHGFRPRELVTSLSADELRRIFVATVSGRGWSIVDDGSPMVAQSSLLAGIRQQIALRTVEADGRTRAHLAVVRYSTKSLGRTTKAHTLRWRMNAFIAAVQRADARATVAG